MSIENIVGEDVNIAQQLEEAPETPEAPAEVQEPAPEPEKHEEPAKTVPLAALHEERQKRRELSEQLAQERRAREEMERRVEERLAAIQKRDEPKAPTWEENPAEHLRHQLGQVTQQTQATHEQIAAWQREQQQTAAIRELAVRVNAAEAEFVKQAPDYTEAVQYLNQRRIAELTALGVDETQAVQQSARELTEAALVFAQNGRNPAQLAYNLAKAKGFAPKPPSDAQKFESQKKGVQASSSLGSGGAPANQLTAQQLLSMNDDEFQAAVGDDAKWRRLMGG